MTRPARASRPALGPASGPFLVVDCHPCGRSGVWWSGAEFVLHQLSDGTTRGCQLPPRDEDRLTTRQRAALDAAVGQELTKRAEAMAA